ncbi:MAG: hypothetical protein SVU94_04950 [Bacteroidota bacterium]|nr:hypothetical protein [Bacteroidota bacterium]
MMVEYYTYHRLNPVIESFIERINELKYRYYASDILNRLMQTEDFNFHIRRAIAILKLTGTPVQNHVTCIYRSDEGGIQRDWKVSELACNLMIISLTSDDEEIEIMQRALLDYLEI